MPPGLPDRQPERVDADREQQPHQRVHGVPLERPDERHLGTAPEDGEQEQARDPPKVATYGRRDGSASHAREAPVEYWVWIWVSVTSTPFGSNYVRARGLPQRWPERAGFARRTPRTAGDAQAGMMRLRSFGSVLDHEYGTACRDDRPVEHPGWDGERLPRPEFNGVGAVEFDAEQPVQDEEELILLVVFVPVEFALHDAQPHQDIADMDEVWLYQGSSAWSISAWTSIDCKVVDSGW